MINSQVRRRIMGHLGAILFNIGIFGLILCFAAAITGLLWIVIFLFVICFAFISVVCTLGLALTDAGFRNFLSGAFKISTNEKFLLLLEQLVKAFPWVAAITGILLVASAIFLFFDKDNPSSKSRLIALSVFAVIFIVAIIVVPIVLGGRA